MDRVAVLSDVNANLEALDAVLADIERQDIKQLWFLGDAIGYGPDPVDCIEKLRNRAHVYLLGRLEYLLVCDMVEPRRYDSAWHDLGERVRSSHQIEWLKERPFEYRSQDITAVHRDPRGPEFKCILLEDLLHDAGRRDAILSCFERLLFIGDNHHPWVFSESRGGLTDKESGYEATISSEEKTVLSVGSVGQPRDGDPRACYAIFTGQKVVWRRVEYDFSSTVAKLRRQPSVSPHASERLAKGI